jgi:hypothetical protein
MKGRTMKSPRDSKDGAKMLNRWSALVSGLLRDIARRSWEQRPPSAFNWIIKWKNVCPIGGWMARRA